MLSMVNSKKEQGLVQWHNLVLYSALTFGGKCISIVQTFHIIYLQV